MSHKLRIGLIFGGKSGEHEVSLQSAKSVYDALDKNKYDVVLIGVDKQGRWILGQNAATFLLNSDNPKLISLNASNKENRTATLAQVNKQTELMEVGSGKNLGKIDVFFPLIHGTFGEDGKLQGMLEMFDVTYVGAGVLGSALGMDKDVQKRLLIQAGLPVAPYVAIRKGKDSKKLINQAVADLGFPLFVKPANMGSSVGVGKAHNMKELTATIKEAFQYDEKILVEQGIEGREIECSVLGDSDKAEASVPGEIIPSHEFYSYDAKYIDEHGAIAKIPADLPAGKIKDVREMAVKVFQTLECTGMGRVDFFYTPEGRFIVNEINTIPGFTKISMYPKLWAASGLPYKKLLDRLITIAIERKERETRLKRNYL